MESDSIESADSPDEDLSPAGPDSAEARLLPSGEFFSAYLRKSVSGNANAKRAARLTARTNEPFSGQRVSEWSLKPWRNSSSPSFA